MPPAKIKLTDAIVAKATLPDGKAESVVWDAEVTGFGLRIRGDAKSYIVAYRPAGAGRSANTKRVKLGSPETIRTATEARRLARALLGRVASGGDPAAERKVEKRRSKSRIVDLLERYDADLERRGYVLRTYTVSMLKRRLARHLQKDITELKGADYAVIIERLEKEGLRGAADGFRARCRAFLSWVVMDAKVLETNPLFGLRRRRDTRADRLAKTQHGRALDDDQIAAVWLATDPTTVFGRYIRFLILTGCRRGEGAGLARVMIDSRRNLIELPASFVKQGRPHTVPIAPALAEVLAACPVEADVPYLFPSRKTGRPITGWNTLTAKLVAASGVKFALHDLRRTFRTGLSRLGVQTEVAELAIGHARAELIEIYDRDRGEDRIRSAVEAWASHVEKIVTAEEGRRAAEAGQGAFG
jgi:integrase